MSRVLAVVEGRTEQTFIQEVLAPELDPQGVFVSATVIGKPGHQGGVRPWASARREILATLKHDQHRYCTTMFDYYALPTDWPGASDARVKRFHEAAGVIERAVHADICGALGDAFDQRRLIPYIQMHEFEALLFTDTQVLADVVQQPHLTNHFDRIVIDCGEPEAIDDQPATAPSKRILSVAPGYQKIVHGAIAAKRIGLVRMAAGCPHFGEWVRRLETLAPKTEA